METSPRIGVTGAAGFIGGHAIEAVFRAGMRPVAIVRPGSDPSRLGGRNLEIREADLLDAAALTRAFDGLAGVIHLAALTRAKSESEFLAANADGVARAVAALEAASPRARFVYVSSLAAAGPSSAGQPVAESDVARPVTPYGRSKLAGESSLRSSSQTGQWTIVRPPIVYGPGERDLLEMFRMARRGVVPVTGPRGARYSIIHAEDLARGAVMALVSQKSLGKTYFLAEPSDYTWEEIARVIGSAVGRQPWCPRIPTPIAWGVAALGSIAKPFMARPPLVTLDKIPEIVAAGWTCSVEQARRDLGFETQIQFAAGAQATADWYRSKAWL